MNWFYANFQPGNWGTTGTQMIQPAPYASVFDDPVNPHLQHVNVMATTNAKTMVYAVAGFSQVALTAYGYATRRDVAIMMVVDRSGSMCYAVTANPGYCSGTGTTPCGSMVTAAKVFTGQFAEGRDAIGMVSFADNAYMHSAPVTNFQSCWDTRIRAAPERARSIRWNVQVEPTRRRRFPSLTTSCTN